MENQPAVQSLERAFRLIELLSHNPDGMPLMELSCTSGLHKSTVHRLLASLSQLGYVKKDESSGRYRLTLKLFELSGRVVDSIDVLGLAKAPLEQLRNHPGGGASGDPGGDRDCVYPQGREPQRVDPDVFPAGDAPSTLLHRGGKEHPCHHAG